MLAGQNPKKDRRFLRSNRIILAGTSEQTQDIAVFCASERPFRLPFPRFVVLTEYLLRSLMSPGRITPPGLFFYVDLIASVNLIYDFFIFPVDFGL